MHPNFSGTSHVEPTRSPREKLWINDDSVAVRSRSKHLSVPGPGQMSRDVGSRTTPNECGKLG